MKNQFIGANLDFMGFSASMLCAIHCAALPFLLSMAPLAGLQFLDNEWIEYGFILLSFLIASNALVHGYRKHHRKILALSLAIVGFILIALAHGLGVEDLEKVLTATGGVFVAVAHVINWKHIAQATAARATS